MPEPIPILAAQIGPDVDVTASPIDADGWQWVRIFPWGTTTFVDGRGPFILDETAAATVLAAFQSGRKLLVDYDHKSDSRSIGMNTPDDSRAAGWIHEIAVIGPDVKWSVDADKIPADEIVGENYGVWARTQWTPTAKSGIEDKEWSFVSPVFWADDEGRLLKLGGAGLTNVPAITELDALAATVGGGEDETMGDNKPTGANVTAGGGEDESWRPIATSLGIQATNRDEFDAELASMKAKADEAATAKEQAEQLAAEKADREARDAATEAVTAAVKAGKVDNDPDTIAAYVKMAAANMDSFNAIMAATKPGSRQRETPPQGKQGRDIGAPQVAAADQDTEDETITGVNLPPDVKVDKAKYEAARAVLASAKDDLKSPAGRRKIQRAYMSRVAGAAGGAS